MILKVYKMVWALILATAALFFLTGNLTEFTAVVFGFISFGMVFSGMMNVLPTVISHPEPLKETAVEAPVKEKGRRVFHAPAVHAR
ncbi:MAG: hypothetical protein R2747_22645 [Pyrinomonadaceae bacterium]